MSEAYLWHLWPGRHWPSTASEEETFVGDLERATPAHLRDHPPGAPRFDRGDVTTILNALRCGVDVAELGSIVQGVRTERLLWAYRHLERLRAAAQTSFEQLLDPRDATLVASPARAAALVPVPASRLIAVYDDGDTHRLETTRAEVAALVTAVAKRAAEIESSIVDLAQAGRRSEAVAHGRFLYDPYGACVWGHPFFVPRRIGELMPSKVRDLLEERTS